MNKFFLLVPLIIYFSCSDKIDNDNGDDVFSVDSVTSKNGHIVEISLTAEVDEITALNKDNYEVFYWDSNRLKISDIELSETKETIFLYTVETHCNSSWWTDITYTLRIIELLDN